MWEVVLSCCPHLLLALQSWGHAVVGTAFPRSKAMGRLAFFTLDSVGPVSPWGLCPPPQKAMQRVKATHWWDKNKQVETPRHACRCPRRQHALKSCTEAWKKAACD